MKRIVFSLVFIGLSGMFFLINAQWLTNSSSWITSTQNLTNTNNLFDNNETTTCYLTVPNHTHQWGTIEFELPEKISIDSINYKWTRRDRKYDYSNGVASKFSTQLYYYNDDSSKYLMIAADTLDLSSDIGSVATHTGWSKIATEHITAKKFKYEIYGFWWWVNTIIEVSR